MKGGTRKLTNKSKRKRRKLGKGQSTQTKQSNRLKNLASSARARLQRASTQKQRQKAAREAAIASARAKKDTRRRVKTVGIVPVRMDTGAAQSQHRHKAHKLTARQQDKETNKELDAILGNLRKLGM